MPPYSDALPFLSRKNVIDYMGSEPALAWNQGLFYISGMDKLVGQLSPVLFWDVDQRGVDTKKNARWLVERVLQRGTWEDWLLLRKLYGKAELRLLAPRLKLDAKSANFLRLYCTQ